MKRISVISVLVLFFAVVSFAMIHSKKNKNAQKQTTDKTGFAVVELFTSEGCSSCPPADKAVADLLKNYPENVYVLGFHVDYWNNLGWKDAFSSSEYSNRQQWYSNVFRLNSVYTPQAIVNGKTEFTGSDTKKLQTAVEEGLEQEAAPKIEIAANGGGNKIVSVSYLLNQASSNQLNIALVQRYAESNIQRGENSGRILHHVNVVRDFKTITAREPKGEVTFTMPADTGIKDLEIIAYVQDAHSWHIVAATKTEIQ